MVIAIFDVSGKERSVLKGGGVEVGGVIEGGIGGEGGFGEIISGGDLVPAIVAEDMTVVEIETRGVC